MTQLSVAQYLRSNKQAIVDEWERAVLGDLTELARIERGALIDHLPEVLDGLAAWIEGDVQQAEARFVELADGHALQRLGFGIELAVIVIEYGCLRRVLLRHLRSVRSSDHVREDLIRCNEGLDRAIQLSVRRYTEHRDFVRERFIGILGHDLRSPLAASMAATDALLRSEDLTERDRKRVFIIARGQDRMTRMISALLDFARGHLGGGIPATPVSCDLGEVCRSAVEEASVAHPDREVRVRIAGDLRGSFDRDRAFQAIGNLISNALHHGNDPVTVSAWESDDRRTLFTRVTNRGAPLAAASLAKLFEPFAHAGDPTKNSLGLGLYIVMQIARAHGGSCDATCEDGSTSFTIRWPRTPVNEVPDRT